MRAVREQARHHPRDCGWHMGEACTCRAPDPTADRRARVRWDIVSADNVRPESVDWLWANRVPLGKLTLIEGYPGLGKSQITLAIAAEVSTGKGKLPGCQRATPANVLVFTAEDGLADTVRPRLEAAGADLARVHIVRNVVFDGDARPLLLPDDAAALAELVERLAARLVLIDPLTAFLSGTVNSWKDQDVRRALAPIAQLAEASHAAALVVRHINKSTAGPAILAGSGSIGMIGAARAAMLAAPDPEDESRRVLAVTKSNLAAKPPSLSYSLVPVTIYDDNGQAIHTSCVAWRGESTHSADALIAATRDHDAGGELEEAMGWLKEQLAGGPCEKKMLVKRGHAAGIALRTLERAKAKLGIDSKRQGFGEKMTVEWSIAAASSLISRQVGGTEGSTGSNPLSGNSSSVPPKSASPVGGTEGLDELPDPAQGRLLGLGALAGNDIPRDRERDVIALLGRANGGKE